MLCESFKSSFSRCKNKPNRCNLPGRITEIQDPCRGTYKYLNLTGAECTFSSNNTRTGLSYAKISTSSGSLAIAGRKMKWSEASGFCQGLGLKLPKDEGIFNSGDKLAEAAGT